MEERGSITMPSNLPVIRTRTKQENIDKMKFIAEYNKRSLAKELELIIEQHIEKFENEHSEIIFEQMTPTEIFNEIKGKIINPPK